jgi:hypothetical protein
MIRAGTCRVGCTVVPKPKTGAGKVELARTVAEKAVPEKTGAEKTAPVKVATERAVAEKTAAEKPAIVIVASKPETKLEAIPVLRPAIAMKVTKDKPATTVSTDQFSRADETSAELEGAEPIKYTEVQ